MATEETAKTIRVVVVWPGHGASFAGGPTPIKAAQDRVRRLLKQGVRDLYITYGPPLTVEEFLDMPNEGTV